MSRAAARSSGSLSESRWVGPPLSSLNQNHSGWAWLSVFITGSQNESNESLQIKGQCFGCKPFPPVTLRTLTFPDYNVEITVTSPFWKPTHNDDGNASLNIFHFSKASDLLGEQVWSRSQNSGFLCPAWLQSHLWSGSDLSSSGRPISLYRPHKPEADKSQVKGS